MRISHKHRFVYLSRPKCASTSVRAALDQYSDIVSTDTAPYHHHTPALLAKKHFDENGWCWNDYFKFTTVRNPWDMLVSLYHFAKPDCDGVYCFQRQWTPYDATKAMPFNRWISEGKSWDMIEGRFRDDLTAYSLEHFACDEGGHDLVDMFIRTEQLTEDLAKVGERLNLDLASLHTNTGRHERYTAYYDNDARERVRLLFSKEIERFGYVFGG